MPATQPSSAAHAPATVLLVLLALLAVAGGGAVAGAAHVPGAAGDDIVHGVPSHGDETTAALLYGAPVGSVLAGGGDAGDAEAICSATLIGCRTVLTAAHCVEDDRRANRYRVFLQHAGLFTVAKIAVHPRYDFPDADVAVLTLDRRVTGIVPTPINDRRAPAAGSRGTIVGYGQSSGQASDWGLKRRGEVVTTSCARASGGELSDREQVCWRYQQPLGAAGEDSNTCGGDSGGPLFVDLGAGVVVAGVTSGGTNESCGPGDLSWDTNVFTHRGWTRRRLGGDRAELCGDLPAVGRAETRVVGRQRHLAAGQAVTYTLQVGAGSRELRVVHNGRDDGSLDADLYLRRGPGAGPGKFDCKADGPGVFGACVVADPQPGTWTATVRAAKAKGAVQLTATSFGGTLKIDAGTVSGGGVGGGGGGGGGGAASCAGHCGDTPDGACWCDGLCVENGDCCGDYRDRCAADDCEERVCEVDPFCCWGWDEICDEAAAEVCG